MAVEEEVMAKTNGRKQEKGNRLDCGGRWVRFDSRITVW